MRFLAPATLCACVLCVCVLCGGIAAGGDARAAEGTPVKPAAAYEGETPTLRQRIRGTLVMTRPVGGIVAIDLATLAETTIRPANAGRGAIHTLSEPDESGRVLLVTGGGTAGRHYQVHITNGDKEQALFGGEGDPLWDHAIAPLSLAPRGGNAAFVVQPPENAGKRFSPLRSGPLRWWDGATASPRDTGITALGERPSWFPDGRRLAYAADAAPAAPPDTTEAAKAEAPEQVVRLLDVYAGTDTFLTAGHLPLVSSDGGSVLVTRGRNVELVLVDVVTHAEKKIRRRNGLGTPIALIDGRYLIYRGGTTPGAPSGETSHNSNFVGPKPLMAIKLMDLQTGQFTTLVPLTDPRTAVTAWVRAAGAQ